MTDEKEDKNSKKMFGGIHKGDDLLESDLVAVCKGLTFISETDGEVIPFTAKNPTGRSIAAYASALGVTSNQTEERDFEEFFDRLTSEKDWHGPRERKRSKRWSKLRDVLEKSLEDIRVIRVGAIQLDIYIVGVDAAGRLAGVKTRAIET